MFQIDKLFKQFCKSINNINLFFKTNWEEKGFQYDEVFETYLNSWAGYAVVTYLLAVGDRHLENLLIDESGHLFHVDFGYIFGSNPASK